MLIAAGHHFKDIRKYKLRQSQAFIELFKTRHQMMLKEQAIIARMAEHAEGKDFMKFIETD